jgi:hypothetical protein
MGQAKRGKSPPSLICLTNCLCLMCLFDAAVRQLRAGKRAVAGRISPYLYAYISTFCIAVQFLLNYRFSQQH